MQNKILWTIAVVALVFSSVALYGSQRLINKKPVAGAVNLPPSLKGNVNSQASKGPSAFGVNLKKNTASASEREDGCMANANAWLDYCLQDSATNANPPYWEQGNCGNISNSVYETCMSGSMPASN